MSTGDHLTSVPAQPGQFHKGPGDDPVMHEGHQPGRMVSPTDQVPTFHGQILGAGEAPEDGTSQPNTADTPSQANNPDMDEETTTSAMDTIGGATSADVHKGLGHPGQGQSSAEQRHGGQRAHKKAGYGLASQGAATNETSATDPRVDESQRGLEKDEAIRGRGNKGATGAEDLPPEQA